MGPEHADLEADWLAEELATISENANKAWTERDTPMRNYYLGFVLAKAQSLENHFKITDMPQVAAGLDKPQPTRYREETRRPRTGFWRFFLGE